MIPILLIGATGLIIESLTVGKKSDQLSYKLYVVKKQWTKKKSIKFSSVKIVDDLSKKLCSNANKKNKVQEASLYKWCPKVG